MQARLLDKVAAGVALASLVVVAAWLWFPASEPSLKSSSLEGSTQPSSPSQPLGEAGPVRGRASASSREADPATDPAWFAAGADVELMQELLESPPGQFDVFDGREWTQMNAWVGVPDIGGPWSLARIECAEEKLGRVVQEPCDYLINVVLRRTANGAGEVVAATAEFGEDVLAEEPGYQGPDPSSASARCRNFARCLAVRGYAKTSAPLPAGPEGELIALQIPGREVTRDAGDRSAWLDAAIESTLAQLKVFEDRPDPGDLSWQFNVALLRRALEYYRWLQEWP